MTMPQPTVLDTTTDLRPATLARLKTELETALRSHEERLVQDPEQDDISMTVYRRSQEAHDEIVAALSRMSEVPTGSARPVAVRYQRTGLRSCPTATLHELCPPGSLEDDPVGGENGRRPTVDVSCSCVRWLSHDRALPPMESTIGSRDSD